MGQEPLNNFDPAPQGVFYGSEFLYHGQLHRESRPSADSRGLQAAYDGPPNPLATGRTRRRSGAPKIRKSPPRTELEASLY